MLKTSSKKMTFVSLLALSVVFQTLPTMAMEIDNTEEVNKFHTFIGLRDRSKLGANVIVGIVEGGYNQDENEKTIIYTSNNILATQTMAIERPLEISTTTIFTENLNQLEELKNTLEAPPSLVLALIEKTLNKLSNKDGWIDHKTSEQKYDSSTGKFEKVVITISNEQNSQPQDTIVTYQSHDEGYEHIRTMHRELIKNNQDLNQHGSHVLDMFLKTAPQAKVKLYETTNLTEIAQDPDIKIINMSCFEKMLSQDSEEQADQILSTFSGSQKLLTLALPNNHQDARIHPFFRLAQNAKGFSAIICSSSSYIEESNLGDVGDYITPEFVEGISHYMTAPGWEIPFLKSFQDEQTISGNSLSAPVIAGGAAILLSYNPDLTHDVLKKLLIDNGRKGVSSGEVVKYHNHLDIANTLNKL